MTLTAERSDSGSIDHAPPVLESRGSSRDGQVPRPRGLCAKFPQGEPRTHASARPIGYGTRPGGPRQPGWAGFDLVPDWVPDQRNTEGYTLTLKRTHRERNARDCALYRILCHSVTLNEAHF